MQSSIEGAVDIIRDNMIHGWVWDSEREGTTLSIEVFGPDGFIASTAADQFRSDLAQAGKNRGNCAFSVQLPPLPLYERLDELSVYVAGTDLDLTGNMLSAAHPHRRSFDFDHAPSRRLLAWQLHRALSDREPNVAEIEVGAKELADGVSGLLAVLRGLRPAPDASPALVDAVGMVTAVFRAVLRREPEPRAIEIYGNALESGMPLEALINELLATPEFTARNNQSSAALTGHLAAMQGMTRAMESAMLTLALEAAQAD